MFWVVNCQRQCSGLQKHTCDDMNFQFGKTIDHLTLISLFGKCETAIIAKNGGASKCCGGQEW